MDETDQSGQQAALQGAIALMGGMTETVRKLNERGHDITGPATVYQWTKTRVPSDYCPDIEAITGTRCEQLRPDVAWGVLRQAKRTPKHSAVEKAA